jgi:hypothetical protein
MAHTLIPYTQSIILSRPVLLKVWSATAAALWACAVKGREIERTI